MEILGVKIDNLDMEGVVERVAGFLEDDRQHYLVTPNPEFLIEAQKDEQFREILNQADLSVSDGTGLILASRFLGQPIKKRVRGVDLMERICQEAAQADWPVFLFGAGPGVAEKAGQNLKSKYPGLDIRVLRTFLALQGTSLKPKILFVALGAPKQEKWIAENLKQMPSVKLAIGVGGAFDFLSGRVRRAPRFIQNIGLEWLWRFGCQPWRGQRIYRAVVKFPWMIVRSKFIHN